MKVKPLYDRLIVKRIEEKEVKTGGIIIPDSAKEKPMEGKVVAVGKGNTSRHARCASDIALSFECHHELVYSVSRAH